MTAPTLLGPWALSFDADGDVDAAGEQQIVANLRGSHVTDLVMFSHGWNNDEAAASSLYARWFDLLKAQLGPDHTVGFIGIRWPSQLWRDVTIPDFDPTPDGTATGAAGVEATVATDAGTPALNPQDVTDLKTVFPQAKKELDSIAALLAGEPSEAGVHELFRAMQQFNTAVSVESTDGDEPDSAQPAMLDDPAEADKVFEKYADALIDSGVDITGGDGGGAAGVRDRLDKLWHGAKEALRGLSYWQMKNRAGMVGQRGVGPLIGRIVAEPEFAQLRIHLIGHSFGGRVVSFALAGLPAAGASPVKSVTLLEGAFSRFAFTDPLPWPPGERGALAGMLSRVDGPLTVCFSSHDTALSLSYPLASLASGDDRAAAEDPLFRFRAIGSLGAYQSPTVFIDAVGTSYPFAKGAILNIDSSAVVDRGDPPSGAHSDIFHEELAWVVASAANLA
ncbi:serine-threonine protein kinase [Mycolicibacterium sp. 018/SC-01/001]|uniref:serine-threonine protein kinase n=1 Tax=Mycolicibacterium sp. 018/SC-01/001 TaxID=2592069 RepID=UPI00117D7904|nr:serine-threonine protein kinase [Mycolicibacterium sp. 018/SC-01/001]TRW86250.1 serine-threonine protein kinase [Mycolicibacterium sp. 018/SC-01/001]